MKRTSPRLINGPTLTVVVDLAVAVGLEQAIILQQLHWWLEQRRNLRDDRYWVYNTYEEWHKQFPFISVRSLKRLLPQMEADGLIATGNYNTHKVDRTKWYTINYDHPALNPSDDSARPGDHSGTMGEPSPATVDSARVDTSVPNGSKELSSEDDIKTALRQAKQRGLTTAQASALLAAHTGPDGLRLAAFMAALPPRR